MELPEGCIANIIARTTPKDACRLCAVSKLFKSAADSDYVWGRFLPSDVVSLVSHSHSHSSLISLSTSNKSLYLALSDRPTVIDKGKMSFQLDKKSGKKCYMLAARALTIVWGDTPRYWEWIPLEESSLHTLYTIVSRLWASTALTSILSLAALFVFSLAASQLRRRSLCLTLRSASTAVAATTVMMETLSSFVASSPPPFSHFVLPLSSSGSNYISTAEATTDLTIGSQKLLDWNMCGGLRFAGC
ncbi:F-box protein PP2-B1 isoform X3 [Arachis ipaensis]|uniref:F-box protein PP2-B1 isoform X3 n=1 Tax=Arachis ipaensis TaxID=130454 RepID=UPI000A2B634C|nr:F-box protein PP2-B1 isoform X3 [Arachis ipaensis]XP_029146530.1 F-box protein PP2-B1 isoform X3 [Arachis hypogaea]